MPIDFYFEKYGWTRQHRHVILNYLKEAQIRYCTSLVAGSKFLGLLTLNDRISGDPFSTEDFDLLKTLGDQTAGNLLSLKLSEKLQENKQMEAFQTMSAFMIHDLKNLASTLALTVKNLPIHFDNPEFRNDALKVMQQGVSKINSMCSHLSMLSQKIELKKVETGLSD